MAKSTAGRNRVGKGKLNGRAKVGANGHSKGRSIGRSVRGSEGLSKGSGELRRGADSFLLKVGLAEMMKNGVIMDVTDVEQAKIAEDSGACAVMALERVPADIRRDGGVARMSAVDMIEFDADVKPAG